jgi:hypothetical protein
MTRADLLIHLAKSGMGIDKSSFRYAPDAIVAEDRTNWRDADCLTVKRGSIQKGIFYDQRAESFIDDNFIEIKAYYLWHAVKIQNPFANG